MEDHPEEGFPGARHFLLHTFAHLLRREFSLECGYNAASIQERIYATNGEHPMAGILLYTAASDSDGTLGGLVELGKADSLERILDLFVQSRVNTESARKQSRIASFPSQNPLWLRGS